MSKILVVNAGSSSLKFQLFNMPSEDCLISGMIGRIGFEDAFFKIEFDDKKIKEVMPIMNHDEATSLVLKSLIDHKILDNLNQIDGVGHRLVHGGELFNSSIIADDDVVDKIISISDLAPLHNPANIGGYKALKKVLNNVRHVFVFDTAFHSTMEEEEYLYPLPYEYYTKYGVRKYGFHGTSHYYVSDKLINSLNLKESKIITCHIGNGASISAIRNGRCIATSMGFTPLSGIMMGTRSGDVDPAIVTNIMDKKQISAKEVIDEFNKKSGLLGLSLFSSDCKDVEDKMEENKQAKLAFNKQINTVVERIGSYYVKLGGCDAIIFTAGVGENSSRFREEVLKRLEEPFGVKIDHASNNTRGKFINITTQDSKIKAYVVPTNEEIVIARDTVKLLGE